MKTCSCCHTEKEVEEFSLLKNRGYRMTQCILCVNLKRKNRYHKYTKAKILAQNKKYYENNKIACIEKYKKYYKKTLQKQKEYRKSYQLNNKEQHNKSSEKYRKNNKEKVSCWSRTRQAKKLKATPKWINLKDLELVYKNKPEGAEVDHIIPLQNENVCGLHVPWNLQYLAPEENYSKNNKFDFTYENKGYKNG